MFKLFQQCCSWVLIATLSLQPALLSAQNIVVNGADTGPRPHVDRAANGTTVINIAKPNGAGVSHDVYTEFQAQDLILNNAPTHVSTQLGGLIEGNPNLASGGSARVWIGEVVGGSQTQLNGILEVGGPTMDVVLANEYGLTCNGCGFVNTSRATLTTGKPVFEASGALRGFDVKQGLVTIGPGGLNPDSRLSMADTGRVDVIARAAAIYGQMRADQINLVAGANQVDYNWSYDPATGAVTGITPQQGTGAAPALAVDVAALGGMYANAIRMVATEQGVGVRLNGDMASSSSIALRSDGRLVLGGSSGSHLPKVKARQKVHIRTQGPLVLAGAVSSDDGDLVDLRSASTAEVSGQVTGGAVTLESAGLLTISGAIAAQRDLSLRSHENGIVQTKDAIIAATSIDVKAKALAALNGKTGATGGLILEADQISTATTGQLVGDSINLKARQAALAGVMSTQGDATLSIGSGGLALNGSLRGDNVRLTAQGDVILSGGILARSAASVTAGQKLTSLSGAETLAAQMVLQALQADLTGVLIAQHSLSAQAETLTVSGQLAADQIALSGASLTVTDGQTIGETGATLTATRDLSTGRNARILARTLVLKGVLQRLAADHIATQSLTVDAMDGIVSSSGQLSGQTVTLRAKDIALMGGRIQATDQARLQATASLTTATDAQVLGQTVSLTAQNMALDGAHVASQFLSAKAETGQITTSGSLVGQAVQLSGQVLRHNGRVLARDNATLTATTRLSSGANSQTHAKTVTFTAPSQTLAGQVTGQDIVVQADGRITLDLSTAATGRLMITSSADDIVQNASSDLLARNISLSAQTVTLASSSNASEALNVGSDALTVQGTAKLLGRDITLTAPQLTFNGAATAANGLTATGQNLAIAGSMTAQALTLNSSDTLSFGGQIATTHTAHLSAAQRLSTATGAEIFGQDITLSAATLDLSALHFATGTITATAQDSFTNAGTLAGQTITASGQAVENNGYISAGQALNLSATTGALENKNSIAAHSAQLTAQSDLINSGRIAVVNRLDAAPVQALTNSGTLTAAAFEMTGTLVNNSGTLSAGAALLAPSDSFTNTGTIKAATLAQITTRSISNTGAIHAGAIALTGQDITLAAGSDLQAVTSLTARATGYLSNAGQFLSNQNASLEVLEGGLNNSGSIAARDLAVVLRDKLTLSGAGKLSGANSLSLTADGITGFGLATFDKLAGQSLSLTLASQGLTVAPGESLQTAGNLTLDLGQGITNRGTMRAGGYLGLASKGNVTNDRGLIKSGGNLQIQALSGAFRNFGGQVDAGGTAQFKVATFHNGINTSDSTTTRKIIRIGAQEYDYDTMVAEAQAAFGGKYTLDWHFLSFGGYDDPNHLLPLYVYLRENYGAIIPLFVMPGRLSLDVDMGVMARLHGDNMPRHALPEGNAHKVTATFSEGVIAQVFDNTNTQIVEVSGTYFDESQTDAGQSLIRSGGAMQVDAGRVTNLYGVLSSGGAMTINAAADVTNSQARYQEKRSAFAVHTHRAKHKGRYHTRVSADRVHRAESKSVAGDRTGFVANGAISINAPGGFHNGGDLDSTGSKLLGELGAGGLIPTTGAATSTTLSADLSQAGQAGQPMKDDIDLTAVAPQAPVLRPVSLTFKDSAGQQAAISALVTSQLAQAQGEQTVLAAQIAAVVPDSFEQLQQSGTKIRNASLTFPNLRDTGSLLDLIRDGQTTIAETNPEFRQLSNFLTSNFLMDVDRLQYRDELVNNTVEPHLAAVLRAPVPQPDAGQFAQFGQTLADSAQTLGLFQQIALARDGSLSGGAAQPDVQDRSIRITARSVTGRGGRIDAGADRIALNALGALDLEGTTLSGGDLSLISGGDVNLSGVALRSSGGTILRSTSGAVTLDALISDYKDRQADGTHVRGTTARLSSLDVGTDLVITSAKDMALLGVQSKITGSATLATATFGPVGRNGNRQLVQTDGNITFGTATQTRQTDYISKNEARSGFQSTSIATRLQTGAGLTASAGTDLKLIGTQIDAGATVSLAAGRNTTLTAAQDIETYDSSYSRRSGLFGMRKSSRTVENRAYTHQKAMIAANGAIDIAANQGDLVLLGAGLRSRDADITLRARQDILAGVVQDRITRFSKSESSGFWGLIKKSEKRNETRFTNTITRATAELDLELVSERNTGLIGANLSAGRRLTLDVGGDLDVQAAIDQLRQSLDASSTGLVLMTTTTTRNFQDKLTHTALNAGDGFDLNIAGATRITRYSPTNDPSANDRAGPHLAALVDHGTLSKLYPEELLAQQGLELLTSSYRPVSYHFHKKTRQLSPVMQLGIKAALTLVSGLPPHMANRVVAGLNMAVSGEFDLGVFAKQLILEQIGQYTGQTMPFPEATGLTNPRVFINNLYKNTLTAGVSSALNGTDFNLGNVVLNTTADSIGALAFNQIGETQGLVNLLGKSVVGCALGEIRNIGCAAGATASTTEALLQETGAFDRLAAAGFQREQIAALNAFLTGTAATLAAGDQSAAQSAAQIAGSAFENNYLKHSDLADMLEELEACRAKGEGCSREDQRQIAVRYAKIGVINDRVLAATCFTTECIDNFLVEAARYNDVMAALQKSYPAAANYLSRSSALFISGPAQDQLARNLDFASGYENYAETRCGGMNDASCAQAYTEAYADYLDDIETVELVQQFLAITTGALALGPAVCSANPRICFALGMTEVAQCASGDIPACSPGPSFPNVRAVTNNATNRTLTPNEISGASLPDLPTGYHYRSVGGEVQVVRNPGQAGNLPPMHLEGGQLVPGPKPGVVRSTATRSAFLKSLADNDRIPSNIRPWLRRGEVPPGYTVHHRQALFDGGTDTVENMVLQGVDLHRITHRFYRPGGQVPTINPPPANPY